MTAAIAADASDTSSVVRAPTSTWLNRSLPAPSVPNGWLHEIGSHRSLGTTFVGSCGVHTSDTSAATTRTATISAPMRPGHDRQTCFTWRPAAWGRPAGGARRR